MLKERYSKISFPLEKKDPNSVLQKYMLEFSIFELKRYSDISIIFAHALRDYLRADIDEWAFSSLCFAITTDESAKNVLTSTTSNLKKYLLDCVDIVWLSKSSSFVEYKQELEFFLQELVGSS